jgi:peptidoglycan/LPS O-acetylase OafA/YrhL
MFFVMSAFLIVTLLQREKARTNAISLKKFYMRRVLRIFPLYYAIVLLFIILFGVIARGSDMAAPFFDALPYYLTYTSNFIDELTLLSVAWSLAAEEQFYLIWPPIEKYLARYVLPVLVVLLLVNQLINYRILFAGSHDELEILQSTFTPILLGVGLAHLLHNRAGFERLHAAIGQKWMIWVWSATLVILFNLPIADISGTPRLLIQLAMTGFVATAVLQEKHALAALFQWKPLLRLGIVSYGVYLFHMLVVAAGSAVLRRVGLADSASLILFVIVLIATYIIAEISFRFYETPFIRFKQRFASGAKESAISVAEKNTEAIVQ